jgi:hypothetical protein
MVGRTIRPAHEIVVVVRFACIRPHIGPGHGQKTMDDGTDEETFAASHGGRVGP